MRIILLTLDKYSCGNMDDNGPWTVIIILKLTCIIILIIYECFNLCEALCVDDEPTDDNRNRNDRGNSNINSVVVTSSTHHPNFSVQTSQNQNLTNTNQQSVRMQKSLIFMK